jgi:hypothetical protein
MSVSLRRFRALVLQYEDVGSGGELDSAFLIRDSGASDKSWWCARAAPTGREITIGMKPEHRIDAVFGFAAEVPVGILDGIICGGVSYRVRAVLPRDTGVDETQVYAERVAELALSTT